MITKELKILRSLRKYPNTLPSLIARNISNYKDGLVVTAEDVAKVAKANNIRFLNEERYAYIEVPSAPTKIQTVWEYLDKNEKELPPYTEFLDVVKRHQELDKKLSSSQTTGKIIIESDKEFFPINMTADWHLGSLCVNYDEWERLFNYIMEHEVYQMLFGDLTDNFKPPFRSIQAIFSQAFSPEVQVEFLASIIKEYKERRPDAILAAWWGNHDVEWDENKFGSSPIKEMLSDSFMYFNGMGVVEVQINDLVYRIGGSHVFRGHSMYNKNHSQGRAVREHFGGLVDVVIQGDKHIRSHQLITEYELFEKFGYEELGGDIHLLQVPTFKDRDGYSMRNFSPTGGQIQFPALLFGTESREIIYTDTLQQLDRYIKGGLT
jgi:hypothetical protein